MWFETRFSEPFASVDTTAANGRIATFTFDTTPGEKLLVVTAISGTDAEGAHKNLEAEAPHNNFDKYVADATDTWNKVLGKIEIESDNADERAVLYTALYHSMLAPVVFSDVDGRYRGPDGEIHTCAPGHKHYSTFSLGYLQGCASAVYYYRARSGSRYGTVTY